MKNLFLVFAFALISVTAQAQNASWSSCSAYTQCYLYDAYGNAYPNGSISCQTYGSAYSGYFGATQSQCQWNVQAYRSVTCSGFVQTTDVYGNVIWGWQNFHYRCPGM